jgi:hypothetical protein
MEEYFDVKQNIDKENKSIEIVKKENGKNILYFNAYSDMVFKEIQNNNIQVVR